MNATAESTENQEVGITVRRRTFEFADVPHHWLFGLPIATAVGNALQLIFPLGERFFVRSVQRYADQVTDPRLRERVRAFIGQEVRHGMAHEGFFEVMRQQGFAPDRFLAFYEKVAYRWIEPLFGPKMRLATTAALEHFTASLGEDALRNDIFQNTHPVLRDLLLWHAAEEIEHKDVAFDVLKLVDDSYLLRVSGLALASIVLSAFTVLGVVMLLRQDPVVTWRQIFQEIFVADKASRGFVGRPVFLRAIVQYLRPSFHPSQCDNMALANRYLASISAG